MIGRRSIAAQKRRLLKLTRHDAPEVMSSCYAKLPQPLSRRWCGPTWQYPRGPHGLFIPPNHPRDPSHAPVSEPAATAPRAASGSSLRSIAAAAVRPCGQGATCAPNGAARLRSLPRSDVKRNGSRAVEQGGESLAADEGGGVQISGAGACEDWRDRERVMACPEKLLLILAMAMGFPVCDDSVIPFK